MDGPKKHTIKVVDTSRIISDIYTVDPNEIKTKYERGEHGEMNLTALHSFVIDYKYRLKYVRKITIEDDITTLREILINKNILPVIAARGDRVLVERHDGRKIVYTKPAAIKPAADINLKGISIAADEPIQIVGLLVSKQYYKTALEKIILKTLDKQYAIPIIRGEKSDRLEKQASALGYYYLSVDAKNITQIITELVRQLNYITDYVNGRAYSQLIYETRQALFNFQKEKYKTATQLISKTFSGPYDSDRSIFLYVEIAKRLEAAKLEKNLIYNRDFSTLYAELVRSAAELTALGAVTDSPQMDNLSELSIIKEKIQSKIKLRHAYALKMAKIGAYSNIIVSKFGVAKLISYYKQMLQKGTAIIIHNVGGTMADTIESIQINSVEALYEVIPSNVLELLHKEYELIEAMHEAEKNNKCRHINLVYNLRHSQSAALSEKLLKQLEEISIYPEGKKHSSWIVCALCKFNLICPHVVDVTKLMIKRAAYSEIASAMQPYYFRDQSTDIKAQTALVLEPIPVNFCQICLEKITKNYGTDMTARRAGLYGLTGGILKAKIWGMSHSLFDYIIFPTPVDPKSFAKDVSELVNTYIIMENEDNPRWKKNILNDIIDNPTTINIAIYIAAYILERIAASRKGSKDLYIGLEGVKPNAKIMDYATRLINIILEVYRGIISRVTDMSIDYIREKLQHSFMVIHTNGDILSDRNDPVEELAGMLTTYDCVFEYAETVAKINRAIGYEIKNISQVKPTIKTVLGKDLIELITNAKDNINNPKYRGLFLKRAGIKVPTDSTLLFLYKEDAINIHSRIYEIGRSKNRDEQTDRAAAAIEHFEKDKAITKDYYAGAYLRAYELFTFYTKKLISRENELKYYEMLERYRTKEELITKERVTRRCLPLHTADVRDIYRPYHEWTQKVPITLIYDETGSKHRWDTHATMIYENGTYNISELKKSIADDTSKDKGRLIDMACKECGCKYSELNKLNVTKTMAAISMSFNINQLFDYYATRCPVSSVHQWASAPKAAKTTNIFNSGGHMQCAQCGLTMRVLNDILAKRIVAKDNEEAAAYYLKYIDTYKKSISFIKKNKVDELNLTHAQKQKAIRDKRAAEVRGELKNWKADFTYITKVANLAKCSVETIKALGSTEGRDYKDVVEGRNAPPPPVSADNSRIYSAETEIRLAISEYSIIRRGDKTDTLNKRYYSMYEKNKITKADVIEFFINNNIECDNYAEYLELVKIELSPEAALEYVIELFCKFVLSIAEHPKDKRGIMKLFAAETALIMINNQRLFAKPEKFNMKLLRVDEDDDNIELLNGDDLDQSEDQ